MNEKTKSLQIQKHLRDSNEKGLRKPRVEGIPGVLFISLSLYVGVVWGGVGWYVCHGVCVEPK